MAKQVIGIGTSANDGTGDTIRAGGDKINDNFDYFYIKNADASRIYGLELEGLELIAMMGKASNHI